MRTFESLGNRNFLILWLGMLATMAGMNMQMIARGFLVYDLTGSASLLGVVNAGSALPMLGLSLLGGAIADRIERKYIIQAGQAVTAILAVLVGLAITAEVITWYHLLLMSVLQGAAFAFMMPSRQAIISQLVEKDKLTNALALNSAAMSVTTLLGPALAGGIYAFVGPDYVFYLIGALNVIAVGMTGRVPKTGTEEGRSTAVLSDIKAGLVYMKGNRMILVLLVMGLTGSMLAMPFWFLLPVFVVDIYDRGPDAMGLLVSVMGLGSLAGSLVIASIGQWKRGLLLLGSAFVTGICLLLISAIPFYYAAAIFMVPLGLGDSARWSINQALIMEQTDDQFRGRIMSIFAMTWGLMPLAVLPTGILADVAGGQAAVALLGVLLLVTAAAVLTTQRALRVMN